MLLIRGQYVWGKATLPNLLFRRYAWQKLSLFCCPSDPCHARICLFRRKSWQRRRRIKRTKLATSKGRRLYRGSRNTWRWVCLCLSPVVRDSRWWDVSFIAEEPGRGEAATSTLPEAIPKAGSWAQGEQVPPICRTHCSAHNIQEQFCCKHHSWCI